MIKDTTALLAWAVVMCAGFGGAVYLGVNGQPWLAFFLLLVMGGVRVSTKDGADGQA